MAESDDIGIDSPLSLTRDVTSASLKSARFERGFSSGDGDFGLESLDCGSAQVPVTGSQISSVIDVAGQEG